jgi:hypothetical protein
MSHVILNGAPYTANPALGSWGDLLDEVDREIAASGTIVGSVRFDGVDEPGFREPAILIRPLETDLIVEIDTEAPGALLGRVLDEAAASLPALERSTLVIAEGFRAADVTPASQGLVQLAESLMNLVALVAAASAAAGIPVATLAVNGEPVGTALANLDTALGPMLEAQAARDYITVADCLEFDVAPAIGPLASVIDAVRDATAERIPGA